ncbi:MAG: HPF/RaiA family ribosome-associated protein [Deltaproteobacteria bacterium]|nr:HPF/RaiA family ribosome-associated protein [Deltaproteobacteria bacterium]MBN2673930.1 HPF/RaiA family ribosome-associated protein [Deltaproteobacteria bacterium]
MRNTLTISFKDTKHTAHMVQFIENKFKRLKKMNPKIIQCSVVIRTPHQKLTTGNQTQVSITLQVPGKELISKKTTAPHEGMDLYSAVSDGFFALESQLKAMRPKRVTFQNFRKLPYLDLPQFSG